jgi:hypothetical protein
MCVCVCVYVLFTVNEPSPRLTASKLSEGKWDNFVTSQHDAGFAWAINPVDGYRHLLPEDMLKGYVRPQAAKRAVSVVAVVAAAAVVDNAAVNQQAAAAVVEVDSQFSDDDDVVIE